MIDVSSYQGIVDWDKVYTDGVRFAYVKATEGLHLVDSQAKRNVVNARAAGVEVGIYHFAHPSNSPLDEARAFLRAGLITKGDLPPALDLEVTEGQSYEHLNDWKAQFLAHVDDAIGVPHGTVFYSYFYFWKRMILFTDRPVWGAAYGPGFKPPHEWVLWQYGSNGRCRGVIGPVDVSKVLRNSRLRRVAKTP